MIIKIGQPAPDFTLFDSEKKQLTLSELKGNNVLLLFFPLAFTKTCTEELCHVRDNINDYNNADAKVFSCWSSLYFASVCKASTEMPNTLASALL